MHDIRAAGVAFETAPATSGPATGCCYILVTPDGERTMNTYLGAAQELTSDDIDAVQIAASSFTYLEGYLWDPPHAKEAFVKASTIAHEAGRQVALTLSDAFCVGRYRGEFLELIGPARSIWCSPTRAELNALYQTSDFDTALAQLRGDAKLAWSPAARRAAWWSSKRRRRSRCRRFRSKGWWIPPAPAICSPPAFCSGWCAAAVMKLRRGWARSPRPK